MNHFDLWFSKFATKRILTSISPQLFPNQTLSSWASYSLWTLIDLPHQYPSVTLVAPASPAHVPIPRPALHHPIFPGLQPLWMPPLNLLSLPQSPNLGTTWPSPTPLFFFRLCIYFLSKSVHYSVILSLRFVPFCPVLLLQPESRHLSPQLWDDGDK